uniref:Uncharacterized protein n=1 Tax=Plectus sambesii TaxID=2011161 RepID=A0A914UJ70_9BILA
METKPAAPDGVESRAPQELTPSTVNERPRPPGPIDKNHVASGRCRTRVSCDLIATSKSSNERRSVYDFCPPVSAKKRRRIKGNRRRPDRNRPIIDRRPIANRRRISRAAAPAETSSVVIYDGRRLRPAPVRIISHPASSLRQWLGLWSPVSGHPLIPDDRHRSIPRSYLTKSIGVQSPKKPFSVQSPSSTMGGRWTTLLIAPILFTSAIARSLQTPPSSAAVALKKTPH